MDTNAPEPVFSLKRGFSLRLKLTLWMLVIFVVIQVSLAFVLQLYQAKSIENFVNDRYIRRAQLAGALVRPTLPQVTDASLEELVRQQGTMLPSPDLSLHIFDENGKPIASSRRPIAQLISLMAEGVAKGGVPVGFRLPAARGSDAADQPPPMRAAAVRVIGIDGRRYVLLLVNDDMFAMEMLGLVTQIILVSISIGIFATGVSAYLIAGIAVRPFAEITAAAKRLSPESITNHVDVPSMSTEVSIVREELERARKRIQAGFATQERFMSNVSHELKTPIATILTEIQTLNLESTPPHVKDFLRSETQELEKLAQLVDSFLMLTRVRHGKGTVPAAAKCLVRDVILDAYAFSLSFAKQHKVRIDLQLPEGAYEDAAVIGNCDLLRIVFDNILRNAIRFSPEDAVVTVRAWVDQEHVHVSVRDRGSGIPPELIPHIFDRFAQAPQEQRRGRGHGLGLEIALGIAELHSGNIAVQNCQDAGCEFTIRLPLATDRVTNAGPPNQGPTVVG